MYLLGIDLGTSFVKASIVDAQTKEAVMSVSFPENEVPIIVQHPNWAEQSADTWWDNLLAALLYLKEKAPALFRDIGAIGISYQMHGLVCVDKNLQVLRNSIIWCDSRSVAIGDKAFEEIGQQECLGTLLNSPGNFTASKLKWVKENEPEIYKRIYKIMLPGDYISMRLTGQVNTSISALSEGIFWNFRTNTLSRELLDYFGFDPQLFPEIQDVFCDHGTILPSIADALGLPKGIPVSYKAGDQPNNAMSLNVLQPGEVAATAGTSGVIYAVTDQLASDQQSRINSFAHVNYTTESPSIGVLLNINGVGIANSWQRKIAGNVNNYPQMNSLAATIAPGCEGLSMLPFGNGAERMLGNSIINAHLAGIKFNIHKEAHLYRAVQEGVAFAFRYGMDIIRENGIVPSVIRVANANMFLSPVFAQAFVDTLSIPVEVFPVDGSIGAALGAGLGVGIFQNQQEAFAGKKALRQLVPVDTARYEECYLDWKQILIKYI